MSNAAAPPRAPSEMDLQQIEEMFDKADDLMINQSNHADAVSYLVYQDDSFSRFLSTKKSSKLIQTILTV